MELVALSVGLGVQPSGCTVQGLVKVELQVSRVAGLGLMGLRKWSTMSTVQARSGVLGSDRKTDCDSSMVWGT